MSTVHLIRSIPSVERPAGTRGTGPGTGYRRFNWCVLQLRRLRGAGNRRDWEPGDAGSPGRGSDRGAGEPPVRSIQHLRGRRHSSLHAPWRRNPQVCLHRTPAKIYTHKQHPRGLSGVLCPRGCGGIQGGGLGSAAFLWQRRRPLRGLARCSSFCVLCSKADVSNLSDIR